MKRSKKFKSVRIKTLSDFIAENFNGNQSAFARANGVQRAQITQWLKAGYIVVDDKLCTVRRVINDK